MTVTSDDDQALQNITIESAPADTINADVTVDDSVADGNDEVEFTVTLKNEFDNPVEGATVTVDDAENVDALGGIESGDENQTDAYGRATFTANSTTSGNFTVQFSETNAGNDTATVTFEAGDADAVFVDTGVATAVADGNDTLEFTVTVEDANGNPVPGVRVLTTDAGTGIDYNGDDNQTTNGTGQLTVTATSTVAQENITFTLEEQDRR
ncbi:MAG: Ig-like domain-containing protein [Natrialbaceae archaeon]|nr:Ig-like domain-containing protein [Natrialbaceae archaeon]